MMKLKVTKPNISGKLINLRPIVLSDAQSMLDSMDDEEGMRLTGTKGTFTLEKTEKFITRIVDADDRVDYAITLKDDPSYIGEVVLNDVDEDERSANIRIALSGPEYFNKGYGSEAMLLMLKHGFETIKLHRISLAFFEFNPRAQRVYEKVGFVKEGVRRDVLMWDGKYHNDIIMSMLEDEWFAKHGQ